MEGGRREGAKIKEVLREEGGGREADSVGMNFARDRHSVGNEALKFIVDSAGIRKLAGNSGGARRGVTPYSVEAGPSVTWGFSGNGIHGECRRQRR